MVVQVNEFRKMEKEQDAVQAKSRPAGNGRASRSTASQPQYSQGGGRQGDAKQTTARRTDEPLANRGAGRQDMAQPVGAV